MALLVSRRYRARLGRAQHRLERTTELHDEMERSAEQRSDLQAQILDAMEEGVLLSDGPVRPCSRTRRSHAHARPDPRFGRCDPSARARSGASARPSPPANWRRNGGGDRVPVSMARGCRRSRRGRRALGGARRDAGSPARRDAPRLRGQRLARAQDARRVDPGDGGDASSRRDRRPNRRAPVHRPARARSDPPVAHPCRSPRSVAPRDGQRRRRGRPSGPHRGRGGARLEASAHDGACSSEHRRPNVPA